MILCYISVLTGGEELADIKRIDRNRFDTVKELEKVIAPSQAAEEESVVYHGNTGSVEIIQQKEISIQNEEKVNELTEEEILLLVRKQRGR